ncbi:DEAD/DEAH box helicase family protein [Frigoriglobus tundricola]|uniref:Helicase ATP-binding domain-containing protein n=1 Tax=Frigoriglobus tundricola TaxID=2774151 RepID=A0A6M5Z7M0_9BACT|nr:hypothetical protein [Frigoriglobus tundricola]QJX01223.1 hypothetical protein FTUN_8862 [Frigoriglobus tundricola]
MANDSILAPGSRVIVRDEEWLVRSSVPVATGGYAVRVVGTSELVRNQERSFLTELEEKFGSAIVEMRPEDTRLVADDSPKYRRSRLYLESLLRRSPPTDDRVYIGHQAALNSSRYQLVPAQRALAALRPSVGIFDGVGIGKTLEVGILLAELIKRGRGERILVVALKSILAQFQQELWSRFGIALVRLDTDGMQRVRAKIPANKNPFYYFTGLLQHVVTVHLRYSRPRRSWSLDADLDVLLDGGRQSHSSAIVCGNWILGSVSDSLLSERNPLGRLAAYPREERRRDSLPNLLAVYAYGSVSATCSCRVTGNFGEDLVSRGAALGWPRHQSLPHGAAAGTPRLRPTSECGRGRVRPGRIPAAVRSHPCEGISGESQCRVRPRVPAPVRDGAAEERAGGPFVQDQTVVPSSAP